MSAPHISSRRRLPLISFGLVRFTSRSHMLLNANTLTNLYAIQFLLLKVRMYLRWSREIFRNETDFTTRGSLIWILDRTTTRSDFTLVHVIPLSDTCHRFGARLLKSWIGRPLVDVQCVTYQFLHRLDWRNYKATPGAHRRRRRNFINPVRARIYYPAITQETPGSCQRSLQDSIRQGKRVDYSPSDQAHRRN